MLRYITYIILWYYNIYVNKKNQNFENTFSQEPQYKRL